MAAFYAHAAERSHIARADAATKLHDAMARTFATVRTWHARTCLRRELRALNDHFLADIGMSRTEVTKPFWQA